MTIEESKQYVCEKTKYEIVDFSMLNKHAWIAKVRTTTFQKSIGHELDNYILADGDCYMHLDLDTYEMLLDSCRE